jgi:hypothetical protein
MNANVAQWTDELAAEVAAKGMTEESLDDMVQDVASEIASDVNNNGIKAQIQFILEKYGREGITLIRDAFGIKNPQA